MNNERIDALLAQTLEDNRLTRGEKKALKEVFADAGLNAQQMAFARHRAFEMAREAVAGRDDCAVLDWLEGVVKVLNPAPSHLESTPGSRCDVLFSPGEACLDALIEATNAAQRSVDICVFTITDNRISRVIRRAHERGVAVRILTDDDKASDRGSDVQRLREAGVPIRVDRSQHHMHHKFAVFDARLAVTGSYNWTRSAAEHNRENLLVTDEPRVVEPYRRVFDELWVEFGDA